MGNDEAKVKVGVVGAAAAQAELKKITSSFQSFGKEVGSIVGGMAREFGSISSSLAKVDPGSSAQKFRDYRSTITDWSIASKRSIGEVKTSFADLSATAVLPDEQIASFSQALGKATYDFQDSGKALAALRGEGLATGRSLEEMEPIAETLHNAFGTSFNDMPEMFGAIRGAAESLGTIGGPAALQDQIVALGGSLNELALSGKGDAKAFIDVLAATGKGLRPDQQKAVQKSLVQQFTSGGEQLRRNLGIKESDYYDENRNVKVNAQNVAKLREFYIHRTGSVEGARRLMSFHDPKLAASLFSDHYLTDIDKASKAIPSAAASDAMKAFQGSGAGVDAAAQNKREQRAREETGAIVNAIQQGFANAMPSNSLLRYGAMGIGGGALSSLGGNAASSLLGAGFKQLASTMFTVVESGGKASLQLSTLSQATSTAGGALTTFGGGLAALGIGYGIGTLLDKTWDVSGGLEKGAHILTSKDDDLNEGDRAAKGSTWALLKGIASGQNLDAIIRNQTHDYVSKRVAELRGQSAGAPGAPGAKQPPVEVKIVVQNKSTTPLDVVNERNGRSGAQ